MLSLGSLGQIAAIMYPALILLAVVMDLRMKNLLSENKTFMRADLQRQTNEALDARIESLDARVTKVEKDTNNLTGSYGRLFVKEHESQ